MQVLISNPYMLHNMCLALLINRRGIQQSCLQNCSHIGQQVHQCSALWFSFKPLWHSVYRAKDCCYQHSYGSACPAVCLKCKRCHNESTWGLTILTFWQWLKPVALEDIAVQWLRSGVGWGRLLYPAFQFFLQNTILLLQEANRLFLPNVKLVSSHLCLEIKVDIINLFPVWMTQSFPQTSLLGKKNQLLEHLSGSRANFFFVTITQGNCIACIFVVLAAKGQLDSCASPSVLSCQDCDK